MVSWNEATEVWVGGISFKVNKYANCNQLYMRGRFFMTPSFENEADRQRVTEEYIRELITHAYRQLTQGEAPTKKD